jgi:hypothetical protein
MRTLPLCRCAVWRRREEGAPAWNQPAARPARGDEQVRRDARVETAFVLARAWKASTSLWLRVSQSGRPVLGGEGGGGTCGRSPAARTRGWSSLVVSWRPLRSSARRFRCGRFGRRARFGRKR